MNISTILDMAAEAFGDRIGVVEGDLRLTYEQLRELSWAVATRIKDAGVANVALLDVNGSAVPVALFAAAYAGVPYVPINYRLTRQEINELLRRVAPAVVITGPSYESLIDTTGGLQLLSRQVLLESARNDSPAEAQDAVDDVAVQLFTSGTTGKPKAAILRHANLMSYIVGTVEFASATADDAALVTVPPYHIAGISAVLSSCYAGRRMVQLNGFDAEAWIDAVQREQVSNAFVVPTMLSRIVEFLGQKPGRPLPSLRALAYGGGRMPLRTINEAMQLLPDVDFTNAYGLTETSSTITVLGPEDHRAAAASTDPSIRRRLGSVGRPGAVEIQIRDEQSRVLGSEEVGVVFVRGPQVAGEYRALGSQLDAEGWFCTRDHGFLDAAGYLFLEGRADDVIVRGGENISPGEIEEVLLRHPDVRDAVVVAVPDEEWGEGVAAAVVLRPDARPCADELQQSVRSVLRSSRVPGVIVFRDQLPYNELGKVLRRVVRQELADLAAAGAASTGVRLS